MTHAELMSPYEVRLRFSIPLFVVVGETMLVATFPEMILILTILMLIMMTQLFLMGHRWATPQLPIKQ